ncbi:MAG: FAD:protein FMN transferase [Firmicutes bacterium]|nr:FAD:protein FMN transferase [Bacillota bacterium]
MTHRNISKISVLLLLFIFIFSGCSNKKISEPKSKTNFLLGTVITLKIYDNPKDEIFTKSFDRIKDIENKMSINIDNSEVIKINENAGKNYTKVSNDTFNVINKGKYYSKLSNGNFDITIGSLVKLWNIGTEDAKVPTENQINLKLPLINYKNITLLEKENKVKLEKKDMILDLGGIAKGYAADEVSNILENNDVHHAIINLGGNIYVHGSKVDGTPWKIGIQNPFEPRGDYIGIVKTKNKSIVTSGIYERYFEENGKRYHHILDPSTGYPVRNNLAGVSIIADKSIDADALSTVLFSMGLKEGKKLAETLDGVDAVFITKDKSVHITNNLKNNFKLTNNDFKNIK